MKGFFILIFLAVGICVNAQISEKIKVNQVGYLPHESKLAYLSDAVADHASLWLVKSVANDSIFLSSGIFINELFDEASNEYVYTIDFSEVTEPGKYYIEVNGIGRSYNFLISDTVYNQAFKSVMKGFYYQRSGVELEPAYAGKWARAAEYASDAYLYLGSVGGEIQSGDYKNTSGGWRDAGDPNKKVVPACVSVHQLLTLYEYFPDKFSRFVNNIPSDKDFPEMNDFLSEIKVETDWLLSMQRDDGAVWHAVTQKNFFLTGMGSLDPNPRYLMPVSTTATADFAAALSTAYRAFFDVDLEYANRCLSAAENAWLALNNEAVWKNPTILGHGDSLQYPERHGYSQDPPGINNTAVYTDTEDSDEIYWAAVELFISTDRKPYKEYFESHLKTDMWYASGWKSVANIANLSYCLAFKDSESSVAKTLKNAVKNFVNLYEGKNQTTGFGVCLNPSDYYWGSNGLVGHYAYSFLMAYEIFGDEKYKDAALSLLNYLLGANSLNKAFISGIGSKPVKNIFHLPSKWDGVEEVVPGLIPGGPNQYKALGDNDHANLIDNEAPPPAKCYIDSENSFASNESAICDCAVWASILGYFYSPEKDVTGMFEFENRNDYSTIDMWPNPCSEMLNINGYNQCRYRIFSVCGDPVLSGYLSNSALDTGVLKNGIYILEIENKQGPAHARFIKSSL